MGRSSISLSGYEEEAKKKKWNDSIHDIFIFEPHFHTHISPTIIHLNLIMILLHAMYLVAAKMSLKAHLHIRFPHAFSALRCNFLLLTLIEQNQGK